MSAARLVNAWGRGLTLPRDSYLPQGVRGTDPVDPEGTDLAIWKWEQNGNLYAIAFAGKSNKPLWHYKFRSEAQRDQEIRKAIEARKAQMDAKAERSRNRREWQHGLQVGDILAASWGYDQTNVNWYEVVGVQGKSVALREIASETVESEMTYSHVVPVPGRFTGPTIRKIPQPVSTTGDRDLVVKIDSARRAYPWNGKPMYETNSQFGH